MTALKQGTPTHETEQMEDGAIWAWRVHLDKISGVILEDDATSVVLSAHFLTRGGTPVIWVYY